MRTEKQLLELMLANIHLFSIGLCYHNDRLHCRGLITTDEHYLIYQYIKTNRPSKFSSWNAFWNCNNLFYWTPGDVEHRVKWLNKHIKKLSK